MHANLPTPRSLLFVPADSERKLAKAATAGADALILDLEDAVALDNKATAREGLPGFIAGYGGSSQIWVRINDLGFTDVLDDIRAAVIPGVTGLVVPKVNGPDELLRVTHYVEMMERVRGLTPGSVRLLPICTETPQAVLRLPEYAARPAGRISAMVWGAEDLSSALGVHMTRDEAGDWLPVYAHARLQCLLACHALGVGAIDTVYVNFRDTDGCRASAEAARKEGFSGKLAIHPDQVPAIHAAFAPSEAEVDWANRVLAALAASPGAASLDGSMLDMPHRRAAERILARVDDSGGG